MASAGIGPADLFAAAETCAIAARRSACRRRKPEDRLGGLADDNEIELPLDKKGAEVPSPSYRSR